MDTTSPSTSSPTAQAQLPDARPGLLQAIAVMGAVIDETVTASLDQPTPCDDYDLRTLLGHVLTVVRRIRVVITGRHFSEVPLVTVVDDADLLRTWHEDAAALRQTLPSVDLGAMAQAPFGTVPVASVIGAYIGELTTHAWDVAVTIGRVDLLDPRLAEAALPSAIERIPADGREALPFGQVVEVGDDASILDRYLGWMGRDPQWTPPSRHAD